MRRIPNNINIFDPLAPVLFEDQRTGFETYPINEESLTDLLQQTKQELDKLQEDRMKIIREALEMTIAQGGDSGDFWKNLSETQYGKVVFGDVVTGFGGTFQRRIDEIKMRWKKFIQKVVAKVFEAKNLNDYALIALRKEVTAPSRMAGFPNREDQIQDYLKRIFEDPKGHHKGAFDDIHAVDLYFFMGYHQDVFLDYKTKGEAALRAEEKRVGKFVDETKKRLERAAKYLEDLYRKATDLVENPAAGPEHADTIEPDTKTTVGRFTIVNEFSIWESHLKLMAKVVKRASSILKKAGFGYLNYGLVNLVRRLPDSAVLKGKEPRAHYVIQDDVVEYSAHQFDLKTHKGSYNLERDKRLFDDMVSVFVHELAHRLWYKFLDQTDRNRGTDLYRQDKGNSKLFVTDYATTNAREDFAETFEEYVYRPSRTSNDPRYRRFLEVMRDAGLLKEDLDESASDDSTLEDYIQPVIDQYMKHLADMLMYRLTNDREIDQPRRAKARVADGLNQVDATAVIDGKKVDAAVIVIPDGGATLNVSFEIHIDDEVSPKYMGWQIEDQGGDLKKTAQIIIAYMKAAARNDRYNPPQSIKGGDLVKPMSDALKAFGDDLVAFLQNIKLSKEVSKGFIGKVVEAKRSAVLGSSKDLFYQRDVVFAIKSVYGMKEVGVLIRIHPKPHFWTRIIVTPEDNRRKEQTTNYPSSLPIRYLAQTIIPSEFVVD